MGKAPSDFDITTSLTPTKTKKCFKNFKTVDTGIKHGTVLVIIDSMPIEITTYRTDGKYSDFRHPESVSFSKNLKEDLKRRDFTMNALAFNEKSGIVDLFFGTEDIKNKIIKTVGEPDVRFSEDALRMLRALRFSAVLGFEIEENTKNAIQNGFKALDKVSEERIFTEITKLIAGENAKNVILEFSDCFSYILGADRINSFGGENFYLKLASVYSTEEKAFNSLKKLKADNFTVKTVANLIKYRNYKKDDISFKKLLFYEGEEFCKIFDLSKTEEILSKNECIFLKDLKLKGDSLKKLGFENRQIKEALEFLILQVHKDNSLNEKEKLIALLKSF